MRSREGLDTEQAENLPPHSGDTLCALRGFAYACGRSGVRSQEAFRKSD